MKKLTFSLIVLLAAFFFSAAQNVDFKQVDRLFRRGEGNDYLQCKALLEALLPNAKFGTEKCDVLWRLARVNLLIGQNEPTKEGKQKIFGEGIKYAEEAIAQDPKDHQAYLWHCANIGRECQTHSLMEQSSAVKPMMADLEMILYKLDRKDCSEAWQAMAEIYFFHPFKSNDDAIDFATKAVNTIPKDELRISTYECLAKMLWSRNWSANRRKSDISDREEAKNLINKAMKLYEGSKDRTLLDTKDYNAIVELLSTMK